MPRRSAAAPPPAPRQDDHINSDAIPDAAAVVHTVISSKKRTTAAPPKDAAHQKNALFLRGLAEARTTSGHQHHRSSEDWEQSEQEVAGEFREGRHASPKRDVHHDPNRDIHGVQSLSSKFGSKEPSHRGDEVMQLRDGWVEEDAAWGEGDGDPDQEFYQDDEGNWYDHLGRYLGPPEYFDSGGSGPAAGGGKAKRDKGGGEERGAGGGGAYEDEEPRRRPATTGGRDPDDQPPAPKPKPPSTRPDFRKKEPAQQKGGTQQKGRAPSGEPTVVGGMPTEDDDSRRDSRQADQRRARVAEDGRDDDRPDDDRPRGRRRDDDRPDDDRPRGRRRDDDRPDDDRPRGRRHDDDRPQDDDDDDDDRPRGRRRDDDRPRGRRPNAEEDDFPDEDEDTVREQSRKRFKARTDDDGDDPGPVPRPPAEERQDYVGYDSARRGEEAARREESDGDVIRDAIDIARTEFVPGDPPPSGFGDADRYLLEENDRLKKENQKLRQSVVVLRQSMSGDDDALFEELQKAYDTIANLSAELKSVMERTEVKFQHVLQLVDDYENKQLVGGFFREEGSYSFRFFPCAVCMISTFCYPVVHSRSCRCRRDIHERRKILPIAHHKYCVIFSARPKRPCVTNIFANCGKRPPRPPRPWSPS